MPLHRHKLLIVDDNPFFSACLSSLINAEPDLVVCGEATSSASLDVSLMVCSPDVILIDLGLGPESGLGVARKLRQREVSTPLVLISSLTAPPAATLRRIGRCTFWKKGDGDEGFLRLIRKSLSDNTAESPTHKESGGDSIAARESSGW
jgi:two-component system invasion response regulator UvrY